MNAIVVLCHFCEQHGPSVVMCTQPYRQTVPRPGSNGTDRGTAVRHTTSNPKISSSSSAGGDNLNAEGNSGPLVFVSDASSSHVMNRVSPPIPQQLLFPTPSTCRACSFSTRDEPGLVSNDQVTCISYVSTQWPKDPDLLNFVLTACQRSLSCEVCPGPDGAFYFGDEVNGHVISYNFQIQDAQARGLRSQFSFLILCWDRVYLMNLWPFLVSNLSKMARRIQQAAGQVFASEISAANSSTGSGPSTARHVSLGRGTTPPGYYSGISGGPHVRQRRAVDADMRSLATLCKDDQIFCRIHAWFTWLLRACARRYKVLPSYTAPVNEDMLVEQEERDAILFNGSDSPYWNSQGALNAFAPSALSVGGIFGTGFMGIGKRLGVTGDTVEEEGCLLHMVLARMVTSLGARAFSGVAQHVVIGNQLVVQPIKDNLLGCLAVAALARLLPRGCIKQMILSPEYLPPFRCNLLSLTVDAKPPSDTDWKPGDEVQFLAVYRSRCDPDPSLEQYVDTLHFSVCPTLPSVDPKLEHLRLSAKLPELVPPPVITGAPPIVSAYVHRIVQLLTATPPLPPPTLVLAVAEARQDWINRARVLYSFKRCQGPSLSGSEASRRWSYLLSMIDCSLKENASVALFWQGALSQQSRQNPCHTRPKTPSSTRTSRRTSVCSSNADITAAMAATTMKD